DCYTARGVTNLLLKDFDAALNDYRQVIRLQPKNESAHYYVGIIHLGRRQYDQALAALNQAITLRPGFTQPYLASAQIRLWLGRPAEALEDVNTALAATPAARQAGALNDRADVYRAMGRLDEAAADYRKAIELEPKGIDSAVGLALVLEKQGQSEQA